MDFRMCGSTSVGRSDAIVILKINQNLATWLQCKQMEETQLNAQ